MIVAYLLLVHTIEFFDYGEEANTNRRGNINHFTDLGKIILRTGNHLMEKTLIILMS